MEYTGTHQKLCLPLKLGRWKSTVHLLSKWKTATISGIPGKPGRVSVREPPRYATQPVLMAEIGYACKASRFSPRHCPGKESRSCVRMFFGTRLHSFFACGIRVENNMSRMRSGMPRAGI